MRDWIAGHRAMLGIAGAVALAGLFASMPCAATPVAAQAIMAAVALLGPGTLIGSPYWKIVYREAPLRSAAGGPTELDEREHALRDRAHGLSYFLLVTVSIVFMAVAGMLLRINRVSLDAETLLAAVLPYGAFAVTLPVILLEWFEPSGPAPAELDEGDEE